MNNYLQVLESWKLLYGCTLYPAVSASSLAELTTSLRQVPGDLIDLYSVSNGVSLEWFRVLPVYDPSDKKRTWDSIQRANILSTSRYFGRDASLFEHYIIFADIGALACAAFERSSGKIWYQEEDELVETRLSLEEFIDASLREASEG